MTQTQENNQDRLAHEARLLNQIIGKAAAQAALPKEWGELAKNMTPTAKRKKVTLYLDEEVARFFKKLGAGYHDKINQVLRLFVQGAASGCLENSNAGRLAGVDRKEIKAALRAMIRTEEITKSGLRAVVLEREDQVRLTEESYEALGKIHEHNEKLSEEVEAIKKEREEFKSEHFRWKREKEQLEAALRRYQSMGLGGDA